MYVWVECIITPGQFSDEYSVSGVEGPLGRPFSLFANEKDISLKKSALRVKKLAEYEDIGIVVVELPGEVLTEDRQISVHYSQLVD